MAPADWDLQLLDEINIKNIPRIVVVVISILTKIKVKFKGSMMLFCYASNAAYIYALFLTKYLSIDCLF